MDELIRAVQGGKLWMNSFNRVEYGPAFSRFKQVYMQAFIDAVSNCSFLPDLAKEYVSAIEAGWKKHLFGKNAIKVDEKMVLVAFISPMLLQSGNPQCCEFAEEICKAWNAEFPKDCYTVASFDEIAGGFTNSIFGIKR